MPHPTFGWKIREQITKKWLTFNVNGAIIIKSSIIYDRVCSPRFNKNPRFLIKNSFWPVVEYSRYFFIDKASDGVRTLVRACTLTCERTSVTPTKTERDAVHTAGKREVFVMSG